ncbi:MAG: P-loop NTPase [Planctomycetota bacterium]|nr:P-loop NTPase [Planctomycetota bacterium]MEE3366171.1 P-loop NTPase [Planctomycetota bacterium]
MNDVTLRGKVEAIVDPELGRSLGELRMVQSVEEADGTVQVTIELPTTAYPEPERIERLVGEAVGESVDVVFERTVRGSNSGGKIGLKIANVICVGSGKGGVGKSSVAAGLAFALKASGARVGLMDADVYGPSVPHLLGASGEPSVVEQVGPDGEPVPRIQPLEVDGIRLMSMGFHVEEDQAVIWRGPLLHRTLTQFLQSTDWGELDYLVIDMPPGTGDVALTLSQLLSLSGAVIVCTPQQVALLDALKAVSMFKQVKIPVLGMVENMTGDIFGRGGARDKASELGLPFLGELPADPEVRIRGDAGRISTLIADDSPVRDQLMSISQKVAIEVARQVTSGTGLPDLEIL